MQHKKIIAIVCIATVFIITAMNTHARRPPPKPIINKSQQSYKTKKQYRELYSTQFYTTQSKESLINELMHENDIFKDLLGYRDEMSSDYNKNIHPKLHFAKRSDKNDDYLKSIKRCIGNPDCYKCLIHKQYNLKQCSDFDLTQYQNNPIYKLFYDYSALASYDINFNAVRNSNHISSMKASTASTNSSNSLMGFFVSIVIFSGFYYLIFRRKNKTGQVINKHSALPYQSAYQINYSPSFKHTKDRWC